MPTATLDHDETLAALLAGLADAQRAGRPTDVDRAARSHPDLASELRELWAVAQYAQLARQVPLTVSVPAEPDPSPAYLPRTFGDFELLSELGRGGMGVVYKAIQKSLNRVVAIKMVRDAHLATPADRARFRAEAEAAARLQHPNIVGVYEVGSCDGQAFLCMEYVPGRTLGQVIVAAGPLTAKTAARLVAGVAWAVHHAHENGILHRDLKPSNILLSDAPSSDGLPWEAKITDFGLAKQADRHESLTRTGAVVGTPSYMSPEQATGRSDLTPAADVYSLGAVLYEMLTGRPPFRAATPVDTLLMVIEQEPVRPRDLMPSVDRDLELVCLKCLQKPSDLRYQSAADLATDLEAFLAGEPMTVMPGSFGSLVSRMLRETHHAAVLENWGLLWMWHSLAIFLICLATQVMSWLGVASHGAYLALWGTGLFTWGGIFWRLRRRGGPVLFVERQIAHAWAGSVLGSVGLFVIEVVQGLPSLTLSPVLAVLAGVVFFFKAGTLSGQFYLTAFAFFVTAGLMAALPQVGHLLFGLVSAAAFYFPGLKYYRLRRLARISAGDAPLWDVPTPSPAGP